MVINQPYKLSLAPFLSISFQLRAFNVPLQFSFDGGTNYYTCRIGAEYNVRIPQGGEITFLITDPSANNEILEIIASQNG